MAVVTWFIPFSTSVLVLCSSLSPISRLLGFSSLVASANLIFCISFHFYASLLPFTAVSVFVCSAFETNSKTDRIGRSPFNVETPSGQTTTSRLNQPMESWLSLDPNPNTVIMLVMAEFHDGKHGNHCIRSCLLSLLLETSHNTNSCLIQYILYTFMFWNLCEKTLGES